VGAVAGAWLVNRAAARGDSRSRIALRAEHPEFTEEQMEPVYYRGAMRWMLVIVAAAARFGPRGRERPA
jgi:hypothetical protein